MAQKQILVEWIVVLYSCKYLFAGKWHTVEANLDKENRQVNISLSPSFNDFSSTILDYDGSLSLDKIVDEYIRDLCIKDHYLWLESQLLSYEAEFSNNDITGEIIISIINDVYKCKLIATTFDGPKETEDIFPASFSIDESFKSLYSKLIK